MGDATVENEWEPARTAAEQLRRWDAGKTIWSIDLGGMGPGYEQAIQVLAIEIVRDNLNKPLPTEETWRTFGDSTIERIDRKQPDGSYSCGGFSGAQVGAAKGLAMRWLRDGPFLVEQSVPVDRRIQVSSFWPHA